MKIQSRLAIVVLSLTGPFRSHGEVIFAQDFSTVPNGSVANYVSASPGPGQWNSIDTWSGETATIVNGALKFQRPSSPASAKGSFARTTSFDPAPNVLIYRFDLTVSDNIKKTSTALFQVGSGFSTTSEMETAGVHSEFAVNFGGVGSFSLRDYAHAQDSVSTFSGTQTITWVINNSGVRFTYLAPDNTWQTVGNDKWDLWAGRTEALDEIAALTPTAPLTDLKFFFGNGTGTIQMDNFRLENEIPLQAVPEPGAAGAMAVLVMGAGVMVDVGWRRRAVKSVKSVKSVSR